MGFTGGGSGSSDTRFDRSGTSSTVSSRSVPSFLEDLFRTHAQSSGTSSTTRSGQDSFLGNLFQTDFREVPGKSTIDDVLALSPTTFTGSNALGTIAGVDPYGEDYLSGIQSLYDQVFAETGAIARSGPEAVRGGVGRGAMAEADVLNQGALQKFREITKLQQDQAGVTTEANRVLQGAEAARRGQVLGAQDQWVKQYLAGLGTGVAGVGGGENSFANQTNALLGTAEALGSKTGLTTDALTGRGGQTSSHAGWQAGLNCCFIFLEALNGELPWFVRVARNAMCTPARVDGYRWMSTWLVPAMQRFPFVKWLVNQTMVLPFLRWGAYLFHDESATSTGWMWKPICRAWFKVWDVLGAGYGRRNI